MPSAPVNVGFSLLTLFPGRVGGSETNVRGLLGEFARMDPDRAHVTILANRHVTGAYAGFARGAVSVTPVPSYRPGDATASRVLAMAGARIAPRRAARDVPKDLDLMHYPVTVPIPATDLPTLVTLADLQHHELPQMFSRGERAFRSWAYDNAARRATIVMTISAHAKASIVARLGVDPARVIVAHLGVDHTRFSPHAAPDDADRLAALALPPRYVLYPANLWSHKNHARLLEAFARVDDRDLALVLTGQVYGRAEPLAEHARRLGIADRVSHLGHVVPDALPALLRGAGALVFPSLFEGFGLPPLEAMACACPVASSDRASLREVCGDGALLFDPEDVDAIARAIERVTGDDVLRDRLRHAAPAQAAKFTWADAAARHVEAYERAARNSRSAR